MDSFLQTVIDELAARISAGPMQFRLIMQPTMAICLGIRDGGRDADAGTKPFIWALLTESGTRGTLMKSALRRLALSIVVATVIDALVQYLMFGHVRPLMAVIVGTLLMGLPYSTARGLWNRARSKHRP